MQDIIGNITVVTLSWGVIAAIGIICRKSVLAWITRRIDLSHNVALEQVKADLKETQIRLDADLKSNQRQFDALYGSVASGRLARQAKADERRFLALERIWKEACHHQSKSGPASTALSQLTIQAALDHTASNPSDQEGFKEIAKLYGASGKKVALHDNINEEQIYVSPVVWSTYSAVAFLSNYSQIIWFGITSGVPDFNKIFKLDDIKEVLKEVLPEQAAAIEANDYEYCLTPYTPLMDRLCKQLRSELDGEERDASEINRSVANHNKLKRIGHKLDLEGSTMSNQDSTFLSPGAD